MGTTTDWRTHVQPDSRHRIVTKIMETLERQIPISGPEGLVELKKIALGFEENMFAAATSQVDYLRKISLKMLTMETKSQTNGVPNSLPLNTGGGSQQQTGSTQQQSQSSQKFLYLQQHLLNQKQQQLQGNTLSSIMQSHMQQQQPQPQQKKPMLSTLQMPSGLLQPSQSILPQTQPFVMQSYLGLQQNLQSSVAQSTPNVLQHNPQGVLRQPQQQSQQSMHQQAPVLHQQQLPVLPSRQQMNAPNLQPNQLTIGEQNNVSDMQQQQQQQQKLLNLQNNIANMQQHLLGNNIPHQQQLGQQSNMSGLQKQQQQPMHSMPQQVFHSQRPPPEASSTLIDAAIIGNAVDMQEEVYQTIKSMKEKYLPDLNDMHRKISEVCQQHDSLPHPPKSEQIERLRIFKNMLDKMMGFLNLPKSSVIPSLKDKLASFEEQFLNILTFNRAWKPGPPQQQIQQTGCHPLSIQQQQQQQQQHHLLPSSRNVVDVQEEVYQAISSMREKYLPDLIDFHQKISQKCQQHDSLPHPPKSEQIERLRIFKNMLDKMMGFLNLPKSSMIPSLKDKLDSYEEHILHMLNSNPPRKPSD